MRVQKTGCHPVVHSINPLAWNSRLPNVIPTSFSCGISYYSFKHSVMIYSLSYKSCVLGPLLEISVHPKWVASWLCLLQGSVQGTSSRRYFSTTQWYPSSELLICILPSDYGFYCNLILTLAFWFLFSGTCVLCNGYILCASSDFPGLVYFVGP